MPWIKPTQSTRLKLRPIDSSQLGTNEWRQRDADEPLGVISARKAAAQHWEVFLAGPLTIGGKQYQSCFIFAPHWAGVGDVYRAAVQVDKARSFHAPTNPPSQVLLPVPYESQMDNAERPTGSCNVTCFAMALKYFGIQPRTNAKQFEDELFRWLQSEGLNRHSPDHLEIMAEEYGLIDLYTITATMQDVRNHLASGRPCVLHGYFTSFGHLITAVGYDEYGLIVHDPYGEWYAWGYDRNDPDGNNAKGKALHYSYGLIENACMPDGNFWVHLLDRKGWAPNPGYSRDLVIAGDADFNLRKLQPQEFYAVPVAIEVKKSWEGFSATRYRCQSGVWTIGWGTTRWWDGGEIPPGAKVTKADAEKLVARDLEGALADLRDAIDVPLTENQLAALISWQYNCGAIHTATLRRAINEQWDDEKIKDALRLYNKALNPDTGQLEFSQGLANRRESECALWDGRDWREYR